jgi:hypothetical protein
MVVAARTDSNLVAVVTSLVITAISTQTKRHLLLKPRSGNDRRSGIVIVELSLTIPPTRLAIRPLVIAFPVDSPQQRPVSFPQVVTIEKLARKRGPVVLRHLQVEITRNQKSRVISKQTLEGFIVQDINQGGGVCTRSLGTITFIDLHPPTLILFLEIELVVSRELVFTTWEIRQVICDAFNTTCCRTPSG